MTTSDLNAFLLRALRRQSPMTEDELLQSARNVYGPDCRSSQVRERLSELDDKGFITSEPADGITPTTYGLTTKGQHKAKNL